MIGRFINIIGLIIALVLLFVECDIEKKKVENTYSYKYEGRYIYDPKNLHKTQKIATIIVVVNCVTVVINTILAILAIWVGV